MAWSLKGFIKAATEVNVKALEFHVCNGDFETWAQWSLKDKKLADEFTKLKAKSQKGEALRKTILDFTKKRYAILNDQVQTATQLF
jgi:hypothetical protein